MGVPAFRGVNLGGWLVMEDWMTPDYFSKIPPLIDGATVQLQSVQTGKWVNVSENSPFGVFCSSQSKTSGATFHIRRLYGPNQPTFQFRTNSKRYLNRYGARLFANSMIPSSVNRSDFTIVTSPVDKNLVMIQTVGGHFWRANPSGSVTLDGTVSLEDLTDASSAAWNGDTVFRLNITGEVGGEWQLAASLDADSKTIISDHRKTFIVEDDFKWLKKTGLNSVRLPIGYWLAQENEPDSPFVAGGLEILDLAMSWGVKHSIGILLSLHAAAGSQNGFEHSASRDGLSEFGNAETINKTLEAIGFITKRYAAYSSFLGIGVLNEPSYMAIWDITVLKKFYTDSYNIVRTFSSCAYVVISPRIDVNSTEFDGFMTTSNFTNVIIDTHEYNLFDLSTFGGTDYDFNLDYVRTKRRTKLQNMEQGTRLVMVGEWSLAMIPGIKMTPEQTTNFADSQKEVYGKTSGGWFFWSYKLLRNDFPNWSFKTGIESKWLNRPKSTFW